MRPLGVTPMLALAACSRAGPPPPLVAPRLDSPIAVARPPQDPGLTARDVLDRWVACTFGPTWQARLAEVRAPGAPSEPCRALDPIIGPSAEQLAAMTTGSEEAIGEALRFRVSIAPSSPMADPAWLELFRFSTDALRELAAARRGATVVQAAAEARPPRVSTAPPSAVRALVEGIALDRLARYAERDDLPPSVGSEARALGWLLGAERFALAEDAPESVRPAAMQASLGALFDLEPPALRADLPVRLAWFRYVMDAASAIAGRAWRMEQRPSAAPDVRSLAARQAEEAIARTIADRLDAASARLPASELRSVCEATARRLRAPRATPSEEAPEVERAR